MERMEMLERTALLLGNDAVEKLKDKKIALFGLGGVGSYCLEALVRAGIENFLICDADTISPSNLNRQLFALRSTIGRYKVDVAYNRMKDINPCVNIEKKPVFFSKESEGEFDFTSMDFVIDCIDTVTSKLLLIEKAKREGARIISCMGTGNKIYGDFEISDIQKTSVCPLARVMRLELKKRGIKGVDVLYSKETPLKTKEVVFSQGRHLPGSVSFIPPLAGIKIAGHVVRKLLEL